MCGFVAAGREALTQSDSLLPLGTRGLCSQLEIIFCMQIDHFMVENPKASYQHWLPYIDVSSCSEICRSNGLLHTCDLKGKGMGVKGWWNWEGKEKTPWDSTEKCFPFSIQFLDLMWHTTHLVDPGIFLSLGHLDQCKVRAEGMWYPRTRGNVSLLQTQGLTWLLRLQRGTFIVMEITDSTCSTGSHKNKGLTEIQAALGVEWNSFFWQIVCCCHGYGICCTSGLFPTPLGTFLLLMPGFPWIFFCSLYWALDLLASVTRPWTCRSNWMCLHTAYPILQHASKDLPLSLVLQTATSFH